MKKIVKIIVFVLLFNFLIINVNAASNPYKEYSSFGKNCTWFAWDQVYKKLGIALPGWGNANTWYDYAKKAGFEVGKTPKNNSIAVWKWNQYGHVAYVEKAVDNKIYIWDSNTCYDFVVSNQEEYDTCIQNGISEETDNACRDKYVKLVPKACEYSADYWQEPGDLIGYIYLDKAPVKKENNKESKKENPKDTAAVAQKKSNNANLSILEISDIDFEFKNDILHYELVVDNNVTTIKIDAKSEDENAKIDGNKDYKLNVGMNTIKVVITAEDTTEKTYTLEIKRKDNNAYLSELTIDNKDFEFKKDNLEYNLNVSDDVDKIVIQGKSESETAIIEGLGIYELQNGPNTVQIKVIAENGNDIIYKLNINRESKNKSNNIFYVVAFSTIGILIISIGVIIIIKKKRTR